MIDGPWLVQSEYVSTLLEPADRQGNLHAERLFGDDVYPDGRKPQLRSGGQIRLQGVTPYEPFFRVRDQDGKICQGWGAGKSQHAFPTSI